MLPRPPFVTLGRLIVTAAVALPLKLAPAAQAQEAAGSGASGPGFDIDRAFIMDSTYFVPFRVTETSPLRDALRAGRVEDETSLLVMEHPAGRLALISDQLAYHHVAQGRIAGEPWMVSF